MKLFIWVLLILMMVTPAKGAQNFEKLSSHLIIAFGDSLTAGYGVALADAYPALLEKKLKEENYPYHVINAGISGDTTSGGLSRMEAIIRKKPEIVILEFGANDGLRGTGLDRVHSNLSKIIERLQKKKIKILLAGMKLPPNYGEDYTQDFHRIYIDLAKKYRVPLIPFFLEGTAAKEGLNQADGLHPTPEGYKIIVENLWPFLVPLLSK